MFENAHDFGDDLSDAIELLERPRTTSSSTTIVDPDAIVAEVFRRTIDPADAPEKTRALLKELLQVREDGSVVLAPAIDVTAHGFRGGDAPLDRRYVKAAGALKALSSHAAVALDQVRPLSGLAGARKCDHAPAVDLIRTTVADLDDIFASGDPIEPAVDRTLIDLAAHIADLKARFGIDEETNICDAGDEQVVVAVTTLETSLLTFKGLWEARSTTDSFLGAENQRIQKLLVIVVVTLHRLWRIVSPIAWTSTPAGDITAAQLWKWMRSYAGTAAPKMLEARAPAAKKAIHETFVQFHTRLAHLHTPRETTGCRAAFDDEAAEKALNELICHVQRIIEATK